MDTAKLELAAQRYREAEAAFAAARDDLQVETAAFLGHNGEPEAFAEAAKITGWTDADLRGIARQSPA